MWTQVYIDGSSDAAVRNGGSGIHIHSRNGKTIHWLWVYCQATAGQNLLLCIKLPDLSAQTHRPCHISSSLQTANLLSKAYNHPESSWTETHSAFFVTCHNTARLLSSGSLLTVGLQETKRQITLPCPVANKSNPTWKSLMETKALIKQLFSQKWMQAHNPPSGDHMHHLSCYQQTTIFRLHTGWCHLHPHLYCLGLSHTPDYSSRTAP